MQHAIYKQVVLVILDGFGVAPAGRGNAISLAKTPTFDWLVDNFPVYTLQASGPLVGLPWGEMGNSEVGHLNLGAGRIVGQDLPRITTAIQSGEFFKNRVFLEAIEHVKKNHSKLHIMGMISTGGVHSLDEHAYALLGLAAQQELDRVFVHMFTDGRDTDERAALAGVQKLHQKIGEIGVGKIASVTGRFYAMDRGGHWGQTERTYQALVMGKGEFAESAERCIEENYQKQIFDEMIPPTVMLDSHRFPIGPIEANDAVIFTNFRQDRALQLTRMFVDPSAVPQEFRHSTLQNMYFATMTEYTPGLQVHVAFPSIDLKHNLAEVLSEKKFTQFHLAESEKYAHVTAFFNCGRGEKFPGEERTIVSSPDNNSRNYVDSPQMSAEALTDELTARITEGKFNFYVANYANGDMVGHTGNLFAGIKAVESLDMCIKKVADVCIARGAALLITADHGNIEQMINNKTGEIDKDHTTNPVPLFCVLPELKYASPSGRRYVNLASSVPFGTVSDVAPTILDLFGLEKPEEMTGINLFDEMDIPNIEIVPRS